eukprot:5401144-Amphidinium_carterae.1
MVPWMVTFLYMCWSFGKLLISNVKSETQEGVFGNVQDFDALKEHARHVLMEATPRCRASMNSRQGRLQVPVTLAQASESGALLKVCRDGTWLTTSALCFMLLANGKETASFSFELHDLEFDCAMSLALESALAETKETSLRSRESSE